MKQTINQYDFRDAFEKMGRKDQFSYDGLGALFNYLEEINGNMELDVIALCCEFTEYENFAELHEAYDIIEDMDELRDNTTVIPINQDSFIIQNF